MAAAGGGGSAAVVSSSSSSAGALPKAPVESEQIPPVQIPVSSGEVVTLTTDELSEDTSEIIGFLDSESVPLESWYQVMYYRMGKRKSAVDVMTAGLKQAKADTRAATDSKNFAVAQMNAALAALEVENVFRTSGGVVSSSGVSVFNRTSTFQQEVRAHTGQMGDSLFNTLAAVRTLVQVKYFSTIKPSDGDDPSAQEVQQELRRAKLSGKRGLSAPMALRLRFGSMMSRSTDMRKFVGNVRQAFHLANQGFADGVKARAIRDVLTVGSAVTPDTVPLIEEADRTKALDRHRELAQPSNSARVDEQIIKETQATVRRLLDPQQPVLVAAVLGEATALYLMGALAQARAVFAAAIRRAPELPASARVGLGMTLFSMGHKEAALSAFRRALQMDPSNTAALTGLAVLNERSAEQAAPEQQQRLRSMALALLHKAHDLDSACAGALLHLARTSFFDWHLARAAQTGASSSSALGGAAGGRQAVAAQLSEKSPYIYLSARPEPALRPGELLRLVRGGAGGAAAAGAETEEEAVLVRVHTRSPDQGPPPFHPSLKSDEFAGSSDLAGHVRYRLQQPSGSHGGGWKLYRRDYASSGSLARHAATSTSNPRTKAEALYLSGRSNHARGKFQDALSDYRQATQQRPAMAVAHLGEGQCLLMLRRNREGKKAVERALRAAPDSPEALKVMAAILETEAKRGHALRCARRATEVAARDPDAWLGLAVMLQRSPEDRNTKRARAAYRRAARLMIEDQARWGYPPPELFLNIAALLHREGEFTEAESFYKEALQLVQAELMPLAPDEVFGKQSAVQAAAFCPHLGLTCTYNLARLHEDKGDAEEAKARYTEITTLYPLYIPARIRLAAIMREAGDLDGAAGVLQEAIDRATAEAASKAATGVPGFRRGAPLAEDARDAMVMLAALQARRGKGRAVVEDLLAQVAKSMDARADRREQCARLLSAAGFLDRLHRATDPHKRDRALRQVFDAYKDIMRAAPGSLPAAQGLGVVLAEQGRLDRAREVFVMVREMAGGAPGASSGLLWSADSAACVNLAHVLVAQGEHERAAQLYSHALRAPGSAFGSSKEQRVKCLLWLARARAELSQWKKAVEVTAEALAEEPEREDLVFNHSLVRAEGAIVVMKQPPAVGSVKEKEAAIKDLHESLGVFNELVERCGAMDEKLRRWEEAKDMRAQKAMADDGEAASSGAGADGPDSFLLSDVPPPRHTVNLATIQELAQKIGQKVLPAAEKRLSKARKEYDRRMREREARQKVMQEARDAREQQEADRKTEAERRRDDAEKHAKGMQEELQRIRQEQLVQQETEQQRKEAAKMRKKTAQRAAGRARPGEDAYDVNADLEGTLAAAYRYDEDFDIQGQLDAGNTLEEIFGHEVESLLREAEAAEAGEGLGEDGVGEVGDAAAVFDGVEDLPEAADGEIMMEGQAQAAPGAEGGGVDEETNAAAAGLLADMFGGLEDDEEEEEGGGAAAGGKSASSGATEAASGAGADDPAPGGSSGAVSGRKRPRNTIEDDEDDGEVGDAGAAASSGQASGAAEATAEGGPGGEAGGDTGTSEGAANGVALQEEQDAKRPRVEG